MAAMVVFFDTPRDRNPRHAHRLDYREEEAVTTLDANAIEKLYQLTVQATAGGELAAAIEILLNSDEMPYDVRAWQGHLEEVLEKYKTATAPANKGDPNG